MRNHVSVYNAFIFLSFPFFFCVEEEDEEAHGGWRVLKRKQALKWFKLRERGK